MKRQLTAALALCLGLTIATPTHGNDLEKLTQTKPAAKILKKLSRRLNEVNCQLRNTEPEETRRHIAKCRKLVHRIACMSDIAAWRYEGLQGINEKVQDQVCQLSNLANEDDSENFEDEKAKLIDLIDELALLVSNV